MIHTLRRQRLFVGCRRASLCAAHAFVLRHTQEGHPPRAVSATHRGWAAQPAVTPSEDRPSKRQDTSCAYSQHIGGVQFTAKGGGAGLAAQRCQGSGSQRRELAFAQAASPITGIIVTADGLCDPPAARRPWWWGAGGQGFLPALETRERNIATRPSRLSAAAARLRAWSVLAANAGAAHWR